MCAILSPLLAADSRSLLPDGREFVTWEKPLRFTRTYYVDNRNASASDTNPGTEIQPFRSINKAAQVLQPGERVLIKTGVYRERVVPARGGSGPEQMIGYEAAPGATVVIKGSRLVKIGWRPSTGWLLGRRTAPESPPAVKIYELDLSPLQIEGPNPFGLPNMPQRRADTANIGLPPQGLRPYLLMQGMVFVDGRRLEQVATYRELGQGDGRFWCEYDGMRIHARMPGDADPAAREVELVVQDTVLRPRERGLGYIRLKGLTFEHAANPFPRPQRGMVSANRGHHWIIEDCTLRHANSVALDIGNESPDADGGPLNGYSIVRRNHVSEAGICGIAGTELGKGALVEDNLVEYIGWQDAEPAWESAGIKLHSAVDSLLRNNVIRHIRYAAGIWLDWANVNTRVTGNVIVDIQDALHGGIFLEASLQPNMIDHNIVWKVTPGLIGGPQGLGRRGGHGILTTGSDEDIIAHNLVAYCAGAGFVAQTSESRIIQTRGGTARWNKLLNNIFLSCERSIDFPHKDNTAEGNLYSAREPRDGAGLNWIETPQPLRLDLAAWQKYFGFDKQGRSAEIEAELDPDALMLKWRCSGDVPELATATHFTHDLMGGEAAATRKPGPLLALPSRLTSVSIDPRGSGRTP
jgi:hypothetical protein